MNTVQFSPAKDDAYYQSIGAQFKANFQKVFSDGRTTVYSLHYRLEAEAVEALAECEAKKLAVHKMISCATTYHILPLGVEPIK